MDKNISRELKDNIKKLIEIGSFEDAKIILESYKKISENDFEIYSMMGVIAMMEGKLDEADNALSYGLEIDGKDFDLLYNFAYLHEFSGNMEKALKYYSLAKYNAISNDQKLDIDSKMKSLNIEGIKEEQYFSVNKFINKPVDNQILELFGNKEYNEIVKKIQEKISERHYEEVISICSYWITKVENNTGVIYYFFGVAANAIGDFDSAIKYHKKALELDSTLADLRFRKSLYQHEYSEESTDCIGCGKQGFKVVNVSNQSISEDNKELVNPIRRWVSCENCGLIYANPLPSEANLNKYYSLIAKEKFGGIYGNIDDRFEFLVSMANKRLEKIERYTGGAKSILDIGTGIGVFTGTALDRGWNADGLEFTPEDCSYAKEKFNLDLKQENFYNFREDRKYDVVTLFEVIEHLHHPLKDLKQINKLIKDDGLLVVATPIQDTLYGKKTKENNVFWNVVTHLSYFTRDVMLKYLNDAGFEVVEISGSNEGMGRMEFYCRKISI
ncbi:methyltransferase domain-containing protein [Proteocatella sphenisci]|uniref:methyltransferase domain-containing protein n=1 Tax=Proteocatella sphenisci TaxID=181070 RepID=UPI00048ED20D|nr:methyltransferase domain-containing protein [Proteocatella sphenisci]